MGDFSGGPRKLYFPIWQEFIPLWRNLRMYPCDEDRILIARLSETQFIAVAIHPCVGTDTVYGRAGWYPVWVAIRPSVGDGYPLMNAMT